jgi:serine protease Do
MLHLVKRSLIGAGLVGIVGVVGSASTAMAQAPSTSPWLPPLPLGVAAPPSAVSAAAQPAVGAPAQPAAGAAAGQPAGAAPAKPAAGVTAPQGIEPGASGAGDASGPYEAVADAPGAGATPAAPIGTGADAADAPLTPQQLYEHVLRGVVALERNGVPMAIGTVLAGDGRVLTALSGLAGGDGADVRYADGTLVHAKVGRSDRGSDLALLVPASLKWTEGLSASDADPAGQELRAILPAHGAHLGPAIAAVKGQVDAHARDGAALLRMLDVDLKGVPVAGAPLLDSTGGVVGVLVRACKGAPASTSGADDVPAGTWYPTPAPAVAAAHAACKSVVLGAPVKAIRSFLTHAASASPAPAPWLGIRGEPEHAGNVVGVRVVAVAPSSPAEKAALKPATDVIVAVDGHPIDTPEKLADLIAKHAPGDTVKLLVFAGEQFRDVAVALRTAP